MPNLLARWREARPVVRAEIIATTWECFSVLLFISAVLPAALASPWAGALFFAGLATSAAIAGPLTRRGRRGIAWAAALRTFFWLLSVTPLLPTASLLMLVATCGFGIMASGLRWSIYRRMVGPPPARPSPVQQRSDLRAWLAENAAVAGIVGGHVMLLFSVAFLRTASKVVFRAWWEIIPALAIFGTLGFTLAVRPTTSRIVTALRLGPTGEREQLLAGLQQARNVPVALAYVNFVLWFTCTTIGVFYFRVGPERWQWPDAIMQIGFGSLFAAGISFYQRGWHEDTVRPVVERLRAWTGTAASEDEVSLRRRMLSHFGWPLLFTLTLSLFASIGLYRTLGAGLGFKQDFNAITALCASFVMLVLAVGGVFMRAARLLSEPLSTLARAADSVASGELDEAVPRLHQAPREVVALGRSIEAMREALAQTIEALREERAGLETRVAERTAELQTTLDELKQAQTALIQGERMALIGELMAGLAHEIYNPLNAIAGSISSLERVRDELTSILSTYREAEPLLPEQQQQELRRHREALDVAGALEDLAGVAKVVTSATRRSVEIVSNLKSFSRAPTEPVATDLHEGLRETLTLLGHRVRQKDLEIVERFGDLPPVVCRGGEINQVFMNLLGNAIHACAPGGTVAIETRVESRVEGSWALVSVSDDGPGVPEHLVERIFDPFFSTKSKADGTGLGLSISQEIVRRHAGRLEVCDAESPFSGACFICRLPLSEGPKPAARPSRA